MVGLYSPPPQQPNGCAGLSFYRDSGQSPPRHNLYIVSIQKFRHGCYLQNHDDHRYGNTGHRRLICCLSADHKDPPDFYLKMPLKKRGMSVETVLTSIIIGLVVFTVLYFFTAEIISFVKTPIEDQACVQTAVFESLSKKAALGEPVFHLECPQHFVTVVKDEAEENEFKKEHEGTEETIVAIDRPLPNALSENAGKWYGIAASEFRTNKEVYQEYRLNELMAQEMKSCWSRMGRGKLDLFTDWFSVIKYEQGTWWQTDREGGLLRTLSTIGTVLNPFNKEYVGAPKMCVVCSRVRFSESVRDTFPKQPIDSLTTFTLNNPTNVFEGRRPLSYYEFLSDDVYSDVLGTQEGNLKYTYDMNGDVAVVFFRSNLFYLVHTYARIKDHLWYDEESELAPVDAIFLVPYDKVTEECTEIAN